MASTTPVLVLFLVFIHMLICASSQQPEKHNNITLGSLLTAKPQNSKWVSNNKVFAFGFYHISPTLYILGVWFDNIYNKTLVWTAMEGKRDVPVEQGSSLKITNSGLQLLDSRGNLKWSGAPDKEKVSAGAMLDNGNFVLFDDASQPIWQSFLFPTNTLLPGQRLSWRSTMYSKASNTNFSSGRFELAMQDDGNLVLYPVERDRDAGGAYWMSDTGGAGDNAFDLYFSASGFIYVVDNSNNTTKWMAPTYTGTGDAPRGRGNFLRRLTLDSDGILRHYVWNSASWSSIWSPVKDPCKDVKGQCGRNGICRLTEHGNPNCTCPPGFDFIDSEDHFQGCLRNSSQSCISRTTMSELDKTDWPNSQHYSELPDVSEDDCKHSCMDDCTCIVVTYLKPVCWKKQMPLINGRQGTDITTKAFVKVQSQDQLDSSSPPPPRPLFPFAAIPVQPPKRNESKGGKGRSLVLVGISLLGCSTTVVAASFLFIWLCGYGRKTRSTTDQVEGLKAFTYKEIQAATGGFTQELGRGAFGKVYKGTLPDGREIAAKLLDKLSEEDHTEKEFTTEMSVIGTSQHKNLLQLYGFCNDGSHKLLVSEYMSNGSLDSSLFVRSGFLDWNMRVQIAVATARGLLYLHEECRTQVLHCDIKPQNILLDKNFNPKISDFGLAKLMKAEQTRTFTEVRGTRGYLAPEWYKNMPITAKVDVYSYGVMLLEIICCRKTMVLDAPEKEIFLSYWAYGCLKDGTLMKMVEKQVVEGNPVEAWELERMVLVALWCIQEDPNLRPTIKKVVQMLEGTMDIAVPPSPI